MNKNYETETHQNIFQIYLASYKKYKYWLTIFYFLSFVLYILIYNENIANIIEQYKPMRKFLKEYKYFIFFNDPNIDYNPQNITSKLKRDFKFKIKDGNWKKGELQNSARLKFSFSNTIDSLDKYTDYFFSEKLKNYKSLLPIDSMMIEDTIAKYDSTINLSFNIKKVNRRRSYRDSIRNTFILAVEKHRTKLFDNPPFDKISNIVFAKYQLPDTAYKNINKSKMIADSVVSRYFNWERKDIIEPQNFRVPLSFKMFKEYSLLLLVIIAIFLQFYFINFKFYDKNEYYNLIRVPSIKNIVNNLDIPFLSNNHLKPLMNSMSYLINFILPTIVILLIAIQISNTLDSYFWFILAIIIYFCCFFILVKYIWNVNKIGGKVKQFLINNNLLNSKLN